MSTEIARRAEQVPAPRTLDEAVSLGRIYAASGFFQDSREEAQAVVKILAGQTIGLSPFASMTGLYLVKGRLGVSANVMATMVKASERYDYRLIELTDQRCEIAFLERAGQRWDELGRSTFTEADARRAQTGNMGAYPRNMLFARAMSNGVRWFCPDVTSGPTYTPEELGATVNEEGQIIEADVVAPAALPAPEPAADPRLARNAAWEALVTCNGWTVTNGDLQAARERVGQLLGCSVERLKDLTAADFEAARAELLARNAARARYFAIVGPVGNDEESRAADRKRIGNLLGITVSSRTLLTSHQWADAADAIERGPQESSIAQRDVAPMTTDPDADDDPYETGMSRGATMPAPRPLPAQAAGL